MQEFRDAHPTPEGAPADGSEVPPGARVFRSAFQAAEALLERTSQRIDDRIAQSLAFGAQLWFFFFFVFPLRAPERSPHFPWPRAGRGG